MLRTHFIWLVVLVASLSFVSAQPRDLDPALVNGSALPAFAGIQPNKIVAFRHDTAWTQIPVQVDERAMVSFAQIRQKPAFSVSTLVFTDALTWTGADPVPTFDADDELVFMARDAGGFAPAGRPKGVRLSGPAQTVAVNDPLGGPVRYVYLFESDGTLSPGAGKDLATYTYNLLSGAYKTTYKLSGYNPENSVGRGAAYEVHFSDRWILDRFRILARGSSGVDILDRHKFQFAPGNCNRTTNTFSAGGGAMIANRDGPVRAIRSVVGANSGGVTQRDWYLYEGRLDIVTFLRVHAIGSTFFFYDFSPAATGMKYHDNLNRAGVLIDGKPDTVKAGFMEWQFVTGAQGSLTTAFRRDTDITKMVQSSFYDDDTSPSWNQCTGDAFAYAASGPTTGGLPNTDPLRGPANHLTLHRINYFESPGVMVAQAEARVRAARSPLEARTMWLASEGGATPGATVQLKLVAADSVGLPLQIGASFGPGPIAIDTRKLHLAPDALLTLSVGGGAPGIFQGFAGRFDNRGTATAALAIPDIPALKGITLHLAFVTLDGAAPSGIRSISPPHTLRIQ